MLVAIARASAESLNALQPSGMQDDAPGRRRFWNGWRLGGPVALLAIAALIPIMLFAAVSAFRSLERERAQLSAQAVSDARRVSEAVDQEIASDIDDARTLAVQPSLDGPIDLKAFGEVVRREQALHPLWRTVILATPDGNRIFNSRSPSNIGPVVEPDSLRRVVANGEPAIGSIAYAKDWAVPVRAPVIRDGKIKAVVTVVISPAGVKDVIARTRIPGDWITSIVDATGKVVARTHREAEFIGKPASPRALAARQRTTSGLYDGRTLEGVTTVSAFWRSPVTGWSAHIGIPKTLFEAPLRRSIAFLVVGSILALGLTAAFTWGLLRETRRRRAESFALERAQRMEALGRLTGGVAHDFNNLLMIIQGNAEILGRRIADPRAANSLDAIKQATERATRLTRELLTFARGGSPSRAALDVNEAIAGFLGSLRQAVGPEIEVRTLLEPHLPQVTLDRVQFELALLNMAVNARDAMPDGGVLTLSTRRPAPDRVELTVSDTGSGIAPQHLAEIFDPFFTTKPVGAGTGLGLTQVYGMVRQAGGSIDVQSRPGRGTSFVLRLPAAADRRPAPASGPAAPSARPAAPKLRKRAAKPGAVAAAHILLVDDNEAVRAVTAEYLRERSHMVTEAGGADEALAVLARGDVSALVSDIVMPGERDGVDLATEARKRWPSLPVVLVSGYAASAADARAHGFTVLQKPYALDALAELLDGVMAGR
ncbi:MAG: response regulator [Proteobacteria bacterium]|nr:response regulator [Pseudomonadota bacterium]